MTEQDRLDLESDVRALFMAMPSSPTAQQQATVHLSTGSVVLTRQELADRYSKLQTLLARSR